MKIEDRDLVARFKREILKAIDYDEIVVIDADNNDAFSIRTRIIPNGVGAAYKEKIDAFNCFISGNNDEEVSFRVDHIERKQLDGISDEWSLYYKGKWIVDFTIIHNYEE